MSSLGGIVLAAGEGRRMGGPKALLEVGGAPLVERHVARLVEVGCGSLVVVVRPPQADAVRAWLRSYPRATVAAVTTSSQSESLAAALALIATDVTLITPVDLLPAAAATHRALLAALDDATLAVTPTYDGRGGHPVIVRRALLAGFESAPRPLRDVLAGAGVARRRIEVADPRVLGDFDTPADLRALRAGNC